MSLLVTPFRAFIKWLSSLVAVQTAALRDHLLFLHLFLCTCWFQCVPPFGVALLAMCQDACPLLCRANPVCELHDAVVA